MEKRGNPYPPNFEELPVEMQQKIEEEVYRSQMKWTWGFMPGDPRLSSMGSEGVPRSGVFGKKVEREVCKVENEKQ